MNIEKVSSLVRQITNAEMVRLTDTNDYPIVVYYNDIRNDPDNYVLGLRWHDDVGNEYAYDFTEQNLSDAVINNGVIEIISNDGECFPIQLLTQQIVFPVADWD